MPTTVNLIGRVIGYFEVVGLQSEVIELPTALVLAEIVGGLIPRLDLLQPTQQPRVRGYP